MKDQNTQEETVLDEAEEAVSEQEEEQEVASIAVPTNMEQIPETQVKLVSICLWLNDWRDQ